MGPTELTISGFIALAAVLPIAAMVESSKPEATQPAQGAEVEIMSNYVIKPDCIGSDGSVGPCVICSESGQQLGIGIQDYTIN
mgnify:CR=1 FL=1|jgi:hypothetical protein|tara:strand:- start:6344 stop:6592 length:249 start_codon:yes stop_codon:yes gene_type:complete